MGQNVHAALDNSDVSLDNKLRNLAKKMSSFIVDDKLRIPVKYAFMFSNDGKLL